MIISKFRNLTEFNDTSTQQLYNYTNDAIDGNSKLIYVNATSGNDSNNGTSWNYAKRTIQCSGQYRR